MNLTNAVTELKKLFEAGHDPLIAPLTLSGDVVLHNTGKDLNKKKPEEEEVTEAKPVEPVFKAATPEQVKSRPKPPRFDHDAALQAARSHSGPVLGLEAGGGASDYILKGTNVWIIVDNVSIFIHRTNEMVGVDIYPHGNEVGDGIASTYVPFNKVEEL